MSTKVFNHKAKNGVSIVMEPEARCVLHGMISKWSHIFYQLLVSNDPGSFEAIHALLDANVDPPLVVDQFVSINNFMWDNFLRECA